MDERKKYQVSLGSVLDCQMDGFDHTVVFDEFTQAKDFALDAFQGVIDRLTALCEQIREAESYEDLDLGWWEPLFEEIEGDNQSSEPIGEDVVPCQKSRTRRLLNWTTCSGYMWMHSRSVLSTRSCPRLLKGWQSRLRS